MNTQLKVATGLVAAWMMLFLLIAEERSPRFLRWMPFFAVMILCYIVYASAKMWAEAKRQDRWRREQEEKEAAETQPKPKQKGK